LQSISSYSQALPVSQIQTIYRHYEVHRHHSGVSSLCPLFFGKFPIIFSKVLNCTDNFHQQGLAASLPDGISLRRGVDDNTKVGLMKFKGEIGGHYLELMSTLQVFIFLACKGTLIHFANNQQEVYAQAQKLYPDIQVNFTTSGTLATRRDDSVALESRQVPDYVSLFLSNLEKIDIYR
jgi:hypothetical protein